MPKDYEDNYSDYSTTKIDNGSGDLLKKMLVIAGAIIFVLIIIAFMVIMIFSKPSKTQVPVEVINENDNAKIATGTGKLPDDYNFGRQSTSTADADINNKAESLLFADFYKPQKIDFDYQIASYDLPLNIKSDVLNYYDVSKKMKLDPYIDDLNNYGLAIMDNEYGAGVKDFYSAYRKINAEEMPMFLTSDFISYYYQNTLKESFKEIEKSVFYENLWDITKKLYEIASTRYRKDFAEKGISNDPVLEGEKLESSYFAVMLELLKPTKEQINRKTNFTDQTKFSEQEADEFDFILLDYLKKDVLAEVDLIREGKKVEKSPVFFYEKDYKYYNIPKNYINNAKLNNFYLVTKWMNSVFPLYFQGEECPDCLLDKEDWRISLAAANLIAEDFEKNQDLKNEWASIYKTISFFSGLRQDLTYLHFYDVFQTIFDNRSIDDVFSRDNKNWNDDYLAFQEAVLDLKFSNLEGSFSRDDNSLKKKIGMRMLQENYWPNDYIFSFLSGENFTYPKKIRNEQLKFSACDSESNGNLGERCVAMGLDIINLVYPLDYNNYYLDNTDYSNFFDAKSSIDLKLAGFDKYTWQSNIYWSTLDSIGIFLNIPKQSLPVFMDSDLWRDKDLNTALGMWVNLHLPADKFDLNSVRDTSGLSFGSECNKYNYIEPNLALVNDYIAKTDMLSDILVALRLAEKTNVVSINLKELKDNLLLIKNIIIKELNNEELEKGDCEAIEEFSRMYEVKKPGDKEFIYRFDSGGRIKESIDGVKFLTVIKSFNDNKVMLLGSIFNYREQR